jgi:hypothetical protein
MKKLFLLFAFTGIVGAASATSIASFTKATVVSVAGDEKKGDDKKKKDEKAACKKDAKACSGEKEGAKACSGEKAGKSCCKAKAEGEAKTAVAPATTAPAKSDK